MIEPITTVPPTKPKKKTSTKSAIKKKKPSKSKKGESKVSFTMNDLYMKEIYVGGTSGKDDVDTSVQESKGDMFKQPQRSLLLLQFLSLKKVTQMKP